MELQEIEKEETHKQIAIQNFDGTQTVVEADEYKICVPTRKCVQFWAQIFACFMAVIFGLVLIGISLFSDNSSVITVGNTTTVTKDSLALEIGLSLFFLGFGILVPTPYNPNSNPLHALGSL